MSGVIRQENDSTDDSELRGRYVIGDPPQRFAFDRPVHTNGNSAANKAVWWVAGIAVCALLTINGVIWAVAMDKLWALSAEVATIRGQLSTLIARP